jgi:hypothetical protein
MSGISGIRCDPYRVKFLFVLLSGGGAALAPGYSMSRFQREECVTFSA